MTTLPFDESDRLRDLRALAILDTRPEKRFDRLTRMAVDFFDVETCLIGLVDADRVWFKSRQGLEVVEFERQSAICSQTILEKAALVVPDASLDDRFANYATVTADPKIRFYAGARLLAPRGQPVGSFCLIDSKPRSLTPTQINALEDLASMAQIELSLSTQVTIDELTQISNRRGFHMIANNLLSLCRRSGIPAQLNIFDLDDFERINGEFGAATGDQVLQFFAGLLVNTFRSGDAIGRLGDDEFVVLQCGSEDQISVPLDRLREASACSSNEIERNLTWSVGTIQVDPFRHDTIESLIADADVRMHDNKMRRQKRSV